MDVELVAAADLDAVWRDWERLFRADELATPFNSPGWGRAWLEHWSPDAEPWLMRVRDGDRIAGIAPLALRRDLPARVLTMIGKDPGDYWDVIAAPEDRERVALSVGAELARLANRWDAGILNCFPPGSGTLDRFASAGLRIFRRAPVTSPRIELPESFEAYLSGLPSSRRQNLRRHLRRLDNGEVSLREINDRAEVSEVMQRWRALRSLQWQGRGRRISASHEKDHFHRFMLDAVTRLLDTDQAVVWEFSWKERIVGVYVNFADERSFYWYLGGFDPDCAQLGLGKIAIGAGIRASIAAGRRVFDFTRGEDAYKYWYGATDRHLASVIIGHPAVRSRLAMAAAKLFSAYRARKTSSATRSSPAAQTG
ncbi:MAG: GNAT family N-acetyltransferase [Chloroflexota bacterium]|nr:GNAT family N-acetyltransferase [Chloroflexota bacterium]